MKRESQKSTTSPVPLTVLVEEDSRVRRHWIAHFRTKDSLLEVFESAEIFLLALARISAASPNSEFYLDQDFGPRRGVGVVLARVIRKKQPRAKIALVTAYPDYLFESELATGLLDAVYPKFPRHIFGDLFDDGVVCRDVGGVV